MGSFSKHAGNAATAGPVHQPAAPSWSWVPGIAFAAGLACAYALAQPIAAIAGAIAGAAFAWGLARRPLVRVALIVLMSPLPVLGFVMARRTAAPAEAFDRSLAIERQADALLFAPAPDPARAAPLYARAAEIHPSFAPLHKLGLARLTAGDAPGAVVAFRAAAGVAHEDPEAAADLYARALTWLGEERYDLALAALDRAGRTETCFDGLR